MARRGENIYLRKDGRYEGRYLKGHRPDRRPIYGSVYARRYLECKEKLSQAKALALTRSSIMKNCGAGTVTDFMNYWLISIAKPSVKLSTFSNYMTNLEKWINPCLGKMKMSKLDKEHVQRFVNALIAQRLSPGTVRNIYRVLFSAMKKAKDYGYVYQNPCEGIRLPEDKEKEAPLLTISEQKRIEIVASKEKNGFEVLLAIYTGLRIGEICALKWRDVDLEKGIIRISETRQRIQSHSAGAKTMLITGTPKSSHSARVIPLPACMAELFQKCKKHAKGEYVFSHRGKPLEPRVMQYRFKALLKKAGIRDINFHALRHTFATRCIELCFDIKSLSEILGHASAKMTLDKYGHSQFAHKQTLMLNLDRIYELSA